jgi:hypothetical protein
MSVHYIHVKIYNDIKTIAPNSQLGFPLVGAAAERVVDVGVEVPTVIGLLTPVVPSGVEAVTVNVGAIAGAVAGEGEGADPAAQH